MLIIATCFLFLVAVSSSAHLPSTFKKCDKIQPDLNECLRAAAEDAVAQLTKPFKEVALPSLEPLEIPSMTIAPGSGPTNFQQNYNNLKISGFTKGKFTKFGVDFSKKTVTFECIFPQIKMDFQYDINGKVLVLPFYGQGPGSITLDDIKFFFNYNFDETTKKDGKHFKIIGSQLNIEPKLIQFKLDNLFNGDKNLGDNINKVFNDNWQAIFDDVKSSYEDAFNKVFTNILKNFVDKVPISEIF